MIWFYLIIIVLFVSLMLISMIRFYKIDPVFKVVYGVNNLVGLEVENRKKDGRTFTISFFLKEDNLYLNHKSKGSIFVLKLENQEEIHIDCMYRIESAVLYEQNKNLISFKVTLE